MKVAPDANKNTIAQDLGKSGDWATPHNSALKHHGLFHDLFNLVLVLKAMNEFVEVATGKTLLLLKVGAIMGTQRSKRGLTQPTDRS